MNCRQCVNILCCSSSNVWNILDLLLLLLSFGSFLADIATDAIVVYQYYINGHIVWMILTTSFVTVPSFIVQTFSYRWFVADEKVSKLIYFVHIFQLGLFYRFIELLLLGFKMRKRESKLDLLLFNQQQSDMCMLRLFESFTESAPQLVLQLYIMVTTDDWNPWTGVSAIASIVSLSWGISAYSKAMRNVRPEKQKLSWWGLLFQALWRIGMVSSRIISLVLFAVSFGYWIITVLSMHWFVMTVWIFFQKTDFCSTWWEERLYNCVIGVVYCFCFFNLKEGRSRYRMIFFYSLTIAQNIICVLVFHNTNVSKHYLTNSIVFFVPSGMCIGLLSMLFYYRFFHPSGQIILFSQKELKIEKEESIKKNVFSNSTFKTGRKLTHNEEKEVPKLESSIALKIVSNEKWKNNSAVIISENYNSPKATSFHKYHSLSCSWDSYYFVCKICNDLYIKTLDHEYMKSIQTYKSNSKFTSTTDMQINIKLEKCCDFPEQFVSYADSNHLHKCSSLPNLTLLLTKR